MTILIVDNSVAFTGAFKCALNEAEILSKEHRFIFILSSKSTLTSQLSGKGFTVYTLPIVEIRKSLSVLLLYLPMLFLNTLRLNRILKKEKADLVQINDFYNLLGATLKTINRKIKLITYVRFLPAVMPGPLRKIWIKAGLKKSDKIIAVSDAVLKQLPSNPKIQRIYDPVNFQEKLPEKKYESKNTIDILYLGNYITGKGQDHAVEAFAQAYKQNEVLRLRFMGGDMDLEKNKAFKKELEERVISLGLSNVVTFDSFSNNVEETIKEADIILNFSEAESFSMTCAEAAFYGISLIATRCGGPEEIIADKQTGLLVPIGDINAMCQAILTLANDHTLRANYAIAGKNYVREKFSTQKFVEQFNDVLKEENAKITKVLFLVPYPEKHAPSQRFRVELYEPYLPQMHISYKIASFTDKRTWDILYKKGSLLQKTTGVFKGYFRRLKHVFWDIHSYDYVFVHREAAPLGPPIFEWIVSKLWRKKMIYDFDDAIWIPNTSNENKLVAWFKAFWKVKYICKWSYKVAGGNDYLCNYASQYNKNVVRIPTCVDMELKHNKIKIHKEGNVVVGWTGSHSTLSYLNKIIPVIKKLQEDLPFTFLVIADKKPDLPLEKYQFLQWSEETEIEDLLNMDIGVMPLQADEWSEGKCGFKLIQYLSLGIPAIADPVGVNKTIIEEGINGYLCATEDEWESKLKLLITDAHLRQQLGEAGRQKMLKEYSIQSQKNRFADLFT